MATTCWDLLYGGLRAAVREADYQGGVGLVDLEVGAELALAKFSDGREARFDLLVCADGVDSHGRRILFPELAPDFAGYVAVRGLIDEAELPLEALGTVWGSYQDDLVRYLVPGGHVIVKCAPPTR